MLLQFPPATKAHTVKRFVDDDFPPAEQWRSRPDGQFLCNPPIQVAVLFQLPREGLLRRLQGRRPQIRCGARVRNERHLVFSSEERLGACRPLEGVGRRSVQGRFESALLQKRLFDRETAGTLLRGSGIMER
jgi:hypothetical protein